METNTIKYPEGSVLNKLPLDITLSQTPLGKLDYEVKKNCYREICTRAMDFIITRFLFGLRMFNGLMTEDHLLFFLNIYIFHNH